MQPTSNSNAPRVPPTGGTVVCKPHTPTLDELAAHVEALETRLAQVAHATDAHVDAILTAQARLDEAYARLVLAVHDALSRIDALLAGHERRTGRPS